MSRKQQGKVGVDTDLSDEISLSLQAEQVGLDAKLVQDAQTALKQKEIERQNLQLNATMLAGESASNAVPALQQMSQRFDNGVGGGNGEGGSGAIAAKSPQQWDELAAEVNTCCGDFRSIEDVLILGFSRTLNTLKTVTSELQISVSFTLSFCPTLPSGIKVLLSLLSVLSFDLASLISIIVRKILMNQTLVIVLFSSMYFTVSSPNVTVWILLPM